eukprot:1137676-Pelagomonas_calceolata.AAC.1
MPRWVHCEPNHVGCMSRGSVKHAVLDCPANVFAAHACTWFGRDVRHEVLLSLPGIPSVELGGIPLLQLFWLAKEEKREHATDEKKRKEKSTQSRGRVH